MWVVGVTRTHTCTPNYLGDDGESRPPLKLLHVLDALEIGRAHAHADVLHLRQEDLFGRRPDGVPCTLHEVP